MENGPLQLGSATALGSGPLTVNGGILDLNAQSPSVPEVTLQNATIDFSLGESGSNALSAQDNAIVSGANVIKAGEKITFTTWYC